jgi:hypothetical protein
MIQSMTLISMEEKMMMKIIREQQAISQEM